MTNPKDLALNFINGFFMMRQIPQIWIVMKMAFYGTITMIVAFSLALVMNGQVHQVWFRAFDQKFTINFTSWYAINFGSIALAIIICYYLFRLSTYYYRKHKNKQK